MVLRHLVLATCIACAAAASADDSTTGLEERDGFELLPPIQLFGPLIADPREPHFAVIYQRYVEDPDFRNVGNASFGESFPLLGGQLDGIEWELGLLGGVFSIFDLDTPSFDLVNSDFWVAPTLSVRRGRLSAQLRLAHRSSHLGDEFLLKNGGTRQDFGYEEADLIGSLMVHPAVRLYAGCAVILSSSPQLQPLSVQVGVEVRSTRTYLEGVLRPIAGIDYQSREELHWEEELSIVGGVELANPDQRRLRLAILGTFYTGNSPNGQFFGRRARFFGVGAHLYF